MKIPLKTLLLIIFISGCQEPVKQEKIEFILQTKLEDGTLVTQFYPNHVPQMVYQVNEQGLKMGYSISYHKDGALANTTFWENGKKHGEEIIFDTSGGLKEINFFQKGLLEGNSYRYKNQVLTSHQINRRGNMWYEGMYMGPEKILNKLYPLFIEEFFFEDKYYAKIRFPLDHAGKMSLQVKDKGTPVIEQMDKATFQLVINDALDLDGFALELEYLPAPSDTLVHSKYQYTHQIYNTQ